ncbi:MAG: cysteine hydrolase, partial [Nanoarchaeota archaeon]|nr:cysteine hydrolase [Nanoarchaeota archaeon]
IKETALLIVDITNSCCHPKCEINKWNISFNKIRKMIPKLKNFISQYRKAGGKVIFVNCTSWKKEFLAKNLLELYKDPKCRYYSTDKSDFSERFFELAPQKSDLIVTKNTYDAFTNPKLGDFLKKQKIKYIAITGVFGDGCVESTIQGGFSAGYNFIILKDLIETTDVGIRQKLQKLLKEYTWPTMFGKTINSKSFFDFVD